MAKSTSIELEANKRAAIGKSSRKLKRTGQVPAIVYGHNFESMPLALDREKFKKLVLRSESGSNLIFNLKVASDQGENLIPVITHAIQKNPLTDEIIHLDFMHINMDEAIKAKVRVELVGTAVGIKESGGVLVHGLRDIEIKCLPSDIPDKFEVDVTRLKINEAIHVSDLAKTAKVEILSTMSEMLAMVAPPTKEEDMAPKASAEEVLAPKTPEEGAAPAKDKAAAPAAKDKAAAPAAKSAEDKK